MTEKERRRLWARAALAALAVFTSTNFLVMKLAVDALNPLSMMLWRFFFAIVFLIPMPKGGARLPGRTVLREGGVVGALLGLAMVLLAWSLAVSSTGETAFFVSSDAALVPILGFLLFGERPDGRVTAGVFLAIAGLAFLSLDDGVHFRPGSLYGLTAALAFAFWVMALGRVTGRHHPFMLSLVQMLAAFSVTAAGGALLGQLELPRTPAGWASCIYLGVIGTGLRFAVQSYLQRFLTATETSLIYLIEPVSVAAIGAVFLGESLGPGQSLGCGMILCGIGLAQLKRAAGREPVPPLAISEA